MSHYAQACTAEFARKKSAVLRNYVKAVIHGICWMKHHKQEAMKVVAGEPMQRMKIGDVQEMEKHFDAIVGSCRSNRIRRRRPWPPPTRSLARNMAPRT